MSDDVCEVYFNPACSKCREVRATLEAQGLRATFREYLDDHPSRDELVAVMGKLGIDEPKAMMRVNDARFAELGLADAPREALLDALVANPALLERPIVVRGARAVVARPPQRVAELFGFDLERFVRAQDEGATHERALEELRAGRKTTHWMWFVFPQLGGLGRSAMAERYAIASLDEARAYLAHPVLGARLRTCAAAITSLPETSARAIFGSTDAMKLHSSLTLFTQAAPDDQLLGAALARFFGGQPDAATIALLDP